MDGLGPGVVWLTYPFIRAHAPPPPHTHTHSFMKRFGEPAVGDANHDGISLDDAAKALGACFRALMGE